MTYNDITTNERRVSGALALVMHLLFLALLVFGVSWQQKQSGSPVMVELWSSLPSPQPKIETPPPPAVKPPPEPPKPAPKVEPKPEPKPVAKPDIALKEKLEKERKLKEQEKLEKERKLKEQEKLEAKKREDEKKRLAALKEKQAKEEKARLVKQQEEALRRIAQQEAAQATAQAKMMDDYMRRIGQKIRQFVVLPPNMQGNPEAQFDVVQIPGGEVLSAKLMRSSGVPAYDAAVERAILKAQPLPPPPAGMSFSDVRELNLKFRPKE